ncbi:Transcriptional regulator LytR [Lactococcus lactis]|nr:Transcriptional regulator LytR [Lactococcus lactis]
MVEAIGGLSLQNARAFNAQGYNFPQGTISLKNSTEVKAYLTLLNESDSKKLFARQQELVMATMTKLKNSQVIIGHFSQILAAFPQVFRMSFSFGNFKALVVNYHGATRISKINIHSDKVGGSQKLQQFHNQILIWQKYNFKKV